MGDSMPFIPAWFDDLGLTSRQFRIACRVARRGDCYESARAIATHCKISRNTVLAEIKTLVSLGVIAQLRSDNGRPFFRLVYPQSSGTELSRPLNGESGTGLSQGGLIECTGGTGLSQNGSNRVPEGTTPIKVIHEGTFCKREALPKKATSQKRFEKPAVEQVSAYMISRGFDIGKASDQAEAFVDHFEANGWRIGGRAPMKNWRAAVRTWIRNADRWTMSAKPDANKLPRDPALDEDKNPNWWAACL